MDDQAPKKDAQSSLEDALHGSEHQFRTLYNDAYVGLYKYRLKDGRVIRCNNRFAQMLGVPSLEEASTISLGKDRYVDPERMEALHAALLEKGQVDHYEALFFRQGGSTFWVRFSARLVDDGENVEGMAVDFTEEKTAQDQLKDAEKKYRGIFENSLEGIFQCTLDGRLVSANQAMASMLGYGDPEELVNGKEDFCRRFFAEADARNQFLETIRSNGEVSGFEARLQTKDGKERWGWVHARAMATPGGEAQCLEGMVADITSRKEARALEKAHMQAEAKIRAQSEFLGAISQEMRAPMNAITGMAGLLSETELTDQQVSYVHTLETASDSLLSLISNILILSKVEAKTLELEKIPFNLLELVEKTCEAMAVKAHEKKVDLTCNVHPEVPRRLIGDPFHLRQVLVNICEQGVKLASGGSVQVAVGGVNGPGAATSNENIATIEFCVTANGEHISFEGVSTLLDYFNLADISDDSEGVAEEGAKGGIEARISSELVGLMDGGVRVQCKESEAEVCFSVKLERQQKGPNEFSTASILKELSVLIADNDTKNRNNLKEILNSVGARVTESEDGQTALALLKDAWMLPRPYDMVLVSQILPDMNGFQVAEIIKIEHLCPLCLMMFSFTAKHEDYERAKDIGIEYFLKKPLKKPQVLQTLKAAILREKAPQEKKAAPKKGDELPPIDILLVEDSETNRFVIRAYLKNTPCRIHIAENGEKALEKFMDRTFDLIFMDMQMPIMDGYEATAQIRRWEKKNRDKKTPIIAMTADARPEDEERFIDNGFDGLLTKPIKKNNLLATMLDQIMGRPKSSPKKSVDRLMDTLGVGLDEPILAWPNPDLEEIAPHYLDSMANNAITIEASLRKNDFEAIRTLGHQMKGEGIAFGFEAISRLGAVIEEAAKRSDKEMVDDYLVKLKDYLARVQIV